MQKKILLVVITLTFFLTFTKAQKGLPDFSVTDIYGQSHTLISNYLEKGKYVYLDFFTVGCGGCIRSAPKIDTVFRKFGCNYGEIVFFGIDAGHYEPYGTDSSVWDFTIKHKMTFPAISGIDGNGYSAYTDYGNYLDFAYTPYHILISPSKEVVMNNTLNLGDPAINSSQLKDSLIMNYGLTLQQCQGNDFMFFSLISSNDSIVGTIDKNHKTVNVVFPSKTDLSSLTANFRNAVNSTVTVNGTEQISGETINDFTNPLTYEITSENGIHENWTVNVSTNSDIDFYNSKFNIYPNPSTGIFILENNLFFKNNSKIIKANIINITGKIVKTISINELENILDLSELNKGIYFIKIEINNYKIIKKVILY